MTTIVSSVARLGRPTGPRARLFALQSLAELRGHLRAPDFATATIALPIVLYMIFGAPRATEPIAGGGTFGQFAMVGFAIYGVISVVLFGLGSMVAGERGRGYLRLLRVTPLPLTAYFGAKLVFALLASGLIVGLLGLAGVVTGAGMPLGSWIAVVGVLSIGGLALAPIGFLVGFLARPGSASAVALLLLFPLGLSAGTFMPVSELPDILQRVAELTPTYHLAQLARWAAGYGLGVQPLIDVVWVIGGAALAGLIVALTYRRLVGRQFA